MKSLFVCLVAMVFTACKPDSVKFNPAPIAPPVVVAPTEVKVETTKIERLSTRDGHAPTPGELSPSAIAMTTFGEVDLRGYLNSLGALDKDLAGRFETAAFRLVSPAKNVYRLELVMSRRFVGEPALIDLAPGKAPGQFVGFLERLQMNIDVRCVTQAPDGSCDPLAQSTVVISPKAGGSRAAFLVQGAEVSGQLSGNIAPGFESTVEGRLIAVTRLNSDADKSVALGLDLNNKYGTLRFKALEGQTQWRLDSETSSNTYRRRFEVSSDAAAIELPLNPTKLSLPLDEIAFVTMPAGMGRMDLTIKR